MRLVERRRNIRRAWQKHEDRLTAVTYELLQRRFRKLKRELRKGNLRRNLKRLAKVDPLHDQPGAEIWDKWITAFGDEFTAAMIEWARAYGDLENTAWAARGFPAAILDPLAAVREYQERIGRQITNIGDSTRDSVLKMISDWFNTDAGLPSLVEDLQGFFDERRARLIATTEMGYAASQVSLDQMKQYGITKWIWDAFYDFLTCPICDELNGQVFNIGDDMPPKHPNCRCGIIYADAQGLELNQKTGKLEKAGWVGGGGIDAKLSPEGAHNAAVLAAATRAKNKAAAGGTGFAGTINVLKSDETGSNAAEPTPKDIKMVQAAWENQTAKFSQSILSQVKGVVISMDNAAWREDTEGAGLDPDRVVGFWENRNNIMHLQMDGKRLQQSVLDHEMGHAAFYSSKTKSDWVDAWSRNPSFGRNTWYGRDAGMTEAFAESFMAVYNPAVKKNPYELWKGSFAGVKDVVVDVVKGVP